MLVEAQPAFILHTRPYRDSSLLVDILTADYGRLSLVAKGGRKPKNHQRHLLQPFIPLSLSWQGKSQLKTLVAIEAEGDPFQLLSSYLYSAMYANELLTYLLLQDDPNVEIFELYWSLLNSLAANEDLEVCLRNFEFGLLAELGYATDFSAEAESGEQIQANQSYNFVADIGFFPATQQVQANHTAKLTLNISGKYLLAIAECDFSLPEVRLAAKQIAREALKPHLRGKELKSRELFKARY